MSGNGQNVIFYDIDGYPVKIGTTVGYLETLWDRTDNPDDKAKYEKSYILVEWDGLGHDVLIQEMDHEKAQKGIWAADPTKVPFREYPSRLAAI